MCIAIYKPANETITDETLLNCANANPDGCGFSYVNTDNRGIRRMIIKKSMDFNVFLRQYKRATRIAPNADFLIHFRIRTHGETSTINCHPFKIDDNTCFIHNGIVPKQKYHARLSDTQMFNIDYLQLLPKDFMFNSAITKMMEDFIGYSKLVVMDIDENVRIYNSSKGEFVGDIWYSNSSYKTPTYSTKRNNNNSKITTTKNVVHLKDKRLLTATSYVPCEGCKKWNDTIGKMSFFYQGDRVLGYCRECCKNLEELPIKNIESVSVGMSCFLAYRNKIFKVSERTEMIFFQSWRNPWGTFEGGVSDDSPTMEEMREYYEDLEDSQYGGLSGEA